MKNCLTLFRTFGALAALVAATAAPLSGNAQPKGDELFVEGVKTNTMLTVDIQMANNARYTLKVQEGAMNFLQREEETPLRFIIQRASPDSSDFQLIPVELAERMVNGRSVPFLKMLPAAPWGAANEALQRRGVAAMKITSVQTRS